MIAARPNDVFARILDPLAECFTPDVARRIISIRLDPHIQDRIDALAEKANEGALADQERVEYSGCIDALDFPAIVKAKAHMALARDSAK